jgi:hypothetical protein
MNKFGLLFLSFTFLINFSYAQYDWTKAEVYLTNKKTLIGEAKLPIMGSGMEFRKETLKFRIDKKDSTVKFETEEVDSIIFTMEYIKEIDNKKIEETRLQTYIPVFLNKKKSRLGFVQILVEGELRLVAKTILVNYGGNSSNITIGLNGNDTYEEDYMGGHNQVILLKDDKKPEMFYRDTASKLFRKLAMKYFEDCISLKTKIDDKLFKKEDIQEIVRFYNSNCAK